MFDHCFWSQCSVNMAYSGSDQRSRLLSAAFWQRVGVAVPVVITSLFQRNIAMTLWAFAKWSPHMSFLADLVFNTIL